MGEVIIWIAAIVVGVPVVCGFGVGMVSLILWWRLKVRELKVREQQLAMEERLSSDELNAKLLKLDDFGLSPVELASLTEDVRRLREEVAQLKQQISSLQGGQTTG